jgi:F-type H+-transporting ATPase subunit delta
MVRKTTGVAAKRYAKALFDLAMERGKLDEYEAAAEIFAVVLKDAELTAFLTNPRVTNADKLKAVEDAFRELLPNGLPEDFSGLVSVSLEKKRERELGAQMDAFIAMVKDWRGVAEAHITSALPLTQEQVERITELLSKKTEKKIITHTTVDSTVIGGLRVRVGGMLYDGTVSASLEKLKRHLTNERMAQQN